MISRASAGKGLVVEGWVYRLHCLPGLVGRVIRRLLGWEGPLLLFLSWSGPWLEAWGVKFGSELSNMTLPTSFRTQEAAVFWAKYYLGSSYSFSDHLPSILGISNAVANESCS